MGKKMSGTYSVVMLIAVVALSGPSAADFPSRPGYGHIPPAHSPYSGPEHNPPTHFGEPPIGQAEPPMPAHKHHPKRQEPDPDHKHPHHKHSKEHKPSGRGPAMPPHFPAHPPKEGHHGPFPPRRTWPPHFTAPPPY